MVSATATADVRIQRLMAKTMSLFMMLFVSSNEDRLLPRSTQRAIAIMISDKTVTTPKGTAAINVTSLKRANSFFVAKNITVSNPKTKWARTVIAMIPVTHHRLSGGHNWNIRSVKKHCTMNAMTTLMAIELNNGQFPAASARGFPNPVIR